MTVLDGAGGGYVNVRNDSHGDEVGAHIYKASLAGACRHLSGVITRCYRTPKSVEDYRNPVKASRSLDPMLRSIDVRSALSVELRVGLAFQPEPSDRSVFAWPAPLAACRPPRRSAPTGPGCRRPDTAPLTTQLPGEDDVPGVRFAASTKRAFGCVVPVLAPVVAARRSTDAKPACVLAARSGRVGARGWLSGSEGALRSRPFSTEGARGSAQAMPAVVEL
jgi:hypothetical protein